MLRSIWRAKWFFYFSIIDGIDFFLGRREPLTPPKRKIYIGGGHFKKQGQDFLQHFIKIGKLKPHEKVADIGCGIGRMAVPLTKYLDSSGSYEGLDIVVDGIQWCNKNITPQYPNFHFQLADVFNQLYNPSGKQKPSEYRFPYKNETFDFVILTSVFTHILPQDVEHYFSEVMRVLKVGGRCFATFFLLNSESIELINKKLSAVDFKYDIGGFHRTFDHRVPEEAVAHDEAFILSLYEKFGFKIEGPIHYGSWCPRNNFVSHQDIIVALKIRA